MKLTDAEALAWLCAHRYNEREFGRGMAVPRPVMDLWVEQGWMALRVYIARTVYLITPDGEAAADAACAEAGIKFTDESGSIPEPEESQRSDLAEVD